MGQSQKWREDRKLAIRFTHAEGNRMIQEALDRRAGTSQPANSPMERLRMVAQNMKSKMKGRTEIPERGM